MKKILYVLILTSITMSTIAQQMVIQKTDGSNTKVDLNIIESINFIIPCPGTPTVDYGGKIYNTVLIGNQCWLKENLDVGNMITGWPANNSTIEKRCFNDISANCDTFGGLYTWDEAMKYVTTTGTKGICPDGWHMPTMVEFTTLANNVNNSNALKREDQGSGAGFGTNTSGFSALLAGAKEYDGGPFIGLNEFTNYWMGEHGVSSYACNFQIQGNDTTIYLWNNGIKTWFFSIRCIKDN